MGNRNLPLAGLALVLGLTALTLGACGSNSKSAGSRTAVQTPGAMSASTPKSGADKTPTALTSTPSGSSNDSALVRDKIKHVIIIMQENRSFDTYFGTYPGADGIPMQNGVPTVCSPDPQTKDCVKPYHDAADVNSGGPHAATSATTDIAGGKMDGFVAQFREASKGCKGKSSDTPGCVEGKTPDVMG